MLKTRVHIASHQHSMLSHECFTHHQAPNHRRPACLMMRKPGHPKNQSLQSRRHQQSLPNCQQRNHLQLLQMLQVHRPCCHPGRALVPAQQPSCQSRHLLSLRNLATQRRAAHTDPNLQSQLAAFPGPFVSKVSCVQPQLGPPETAHLRSPSPWAPTHHRTSPDYNPMLPASAYRQPSSPRHPYKPLEDTLQLPSRTEHAAWAYHTRQGASYGDTHSASLSAPHQCPPELCDQRPYAQHQSVSCPL
mmetsp:Transcript_24876/g.57350  ORF Transcript_24876/g.57350 Transcript_24876/m.57350 type:complete len:246 (-) Transcript_24876:610-1347(-)